MSDTPLTSKQLLPCPFCGAAAHEFLWQQHFGCSNEKCGAHAANLTREQWNKRTAEPPVASLWQPIETAPKDGAQLLTVRAGFDPCISVWFEFEGESRWTTDPEVFPDDGSFVEHWHASRYEPTHWMPLPEGPSAANFEQWRDSTAATVALNVAPIAMLTVRDGLVQSASLYAPGASGRRT